MTGTDDRGVPSGNTDSTLQDSTLGTTGGAPDGTRPSGVPAPADQGGLGSTIGSASDQPEVDVSLQDRAGQPRAEDRSAVHDVAHPDGLPGQGEDPQ
ncbi:hypothetical protein [Deinococcus sonorensis]|uniref:Uncharacterized protein n=2 Tax=Deinococcus sonorensis TaxID=309891 RepID=A0AAU7U9D9_9DEIO